MQREYTLENWAVVDIPNNPYVPPECKRKCLQGTCAERAREVYYRTPRDIQKDEVTTSPIEKIEGKRITTRSGTVYILGEVNPEYVSFLKAIGKELDQENPIKWIEGKENV